VALQFTSFVKAWRARHIDRTISKDVIRLEALKQEAKCLFDAEAKSKLHSLRVRLFQYALAREVDASKTWKQRVSSDLIDKIAGKCKQRREKLHQAVRRGREWVAVCGRYEGLLPFIFLDKRNPFEIKPADYTNLDTDDLKVFHGLLEDDYVSKICEAGKSLGEIVRFGLTDVFAWEI
jgi:hypothetical protein